MPQDSGPPAKPARPKRRHGRVRADLTRHWNAVSLLPWQVCLLAAILGMLSFGFPLPATVGFAIFLVLTRTHGDGRPGLPVLILAFVLGLGLEVLTVPRPPETYPDWMNNVRGKAQVNGTVSEVRYTPGEGARLILDDLRAGARPVRDLASASAPTSMSGADNATSPDMSEATPAKPKRKHKPKPPAILLFPAQNASLQVPPAQGQDLPGRLLLNVGRYGRESGPLPRPGERISLEIRPRPVHSFSNPGLWDNDFYWTRQGVFFRAYADVDELAWSVVRPVRPGLLSRARDALRADFLRLVPDTDGRAVMLALLMGDRFLLSRQDVDRFSRAGLAHSLALSGLHVGFVAALAWGLAGLAGRVRPTIYLAIPRPKLAVCLGAPMILAYVWLGQGQVSLVRAAIMFAFWGALLLSGRGRVLIDGLCLAVALILACAPHLVFDLSLQLSALAVAAIALFLPPLSARLSAWAGNSRLRRPLAWALDLILISLVVNLALLPVQLGYFATLSPHAYLNLLWVPLLGSVVMPLGLTGMALLGVPGLGPAGGWLIGLGGRVCTLMLELLRYMDGHGLLDVLAVYRPLWPQYLGWFLLAGIAAGLWRRKGVVLALELGLAVCLLVYPALRTWRDLDRDQVSLSLLDVGQGQSALIEVPGGGRTLIDGGGFQSGEYDVGRAIVGPVLTYGRLPRLDRVMLSHTDADHLKGLRFIVGHFRVGEFIWTGYAGDSQEIGEILDIAAGHGVRIRTAQAGEVIDLGGGAGLEIAHPGPDFEARKNNDHSLVARLVWRGTGLALIPGDAERLAIRAMLDSGRELSAKALVLPHHGGKSSLYPEFYARVRPDVALASAGFLNHFGMPNRDVRTVLTGLRIPLRSTSEAGMLRLIWDTPQKPGREFVTRPEAMQHSGPISVENWLRNIYSPDNTG